MCELESILSVKNITLRERPTKKLVKIDYKNFMKPITMQKVKPKPQIKLEINGKKIAPKTTVEKTSKKRKKIVKAK